MSMGMLPAPPNLARVRHQILDIRHVVVRPPDVHPAGANGVIGVARQLVLEQCAGGERARLVVIAPAVGDSAVIDPVAPTEVVPLSGPAIRGRVLRLRRHALAKLLSGVTRTTIFHLHGGREPLLISIARALRRQDVPYVVTVHGRFSHVYDAEGRCQKPRTALYLKLFERVLLRDARFLQALSSEEAQILQRLAPRAHIEIVGNGAYSERRGPIPAPPAARAPSILFPHFVFCGRYAVHHKGLDLLIKGFASYRQRGGTGRLTTIGTGPGRETLIRMAGQLGIADVVDIRGPLFGDARDEVLRACDFFITPSRFEGVPLAALEAALLGLPLIVTKGTGLLLPVQRHGAGVLIEEFTSEAVCVALHRAADLPPAAWRKVRASAFTMAIDIGNWTAIAGRLLQLYRADPKSSPM